MTRRAWSRTARGQKREASRGFLSSLAYRFSPLTFGGLLAVLVSGCVERRYVVTSDPPGALVYKNGQPIGTTPVDDTFVYYGKYHFTLVKDGYETLQVDENFSAPWY